MNETAELSLLNDRESFAAFVMRMRSTGINDPRIFSAIENAQRKNFIDSKFEHLVYTKRSFPIDYGQYIEGLDEQARFLTHLQIESTNRILEIGTGSGFTAAVMGQVGGRVLTLERFKKLCEAARTRLQHLKIDTVYIKHSDARNNLTDGPFDRIISWLAFDQLPANLSEMLATHGILIAPIGPADEAQSMTKISKIGSRFEQETIGIVRYQPFMEGLSAYF